ncbi:MAG: hypothetical protein DA330_02010 [Nitrososphaera sp.]|nr:hypothetical protein [Nitrososphaera sp.]
MRTSCLIALVILVFAAPAISKPGEKPKPETNKSPFGRAMPPPEWRPENFNADKYFIRDGDIKALKKEIDILVNIDYQRHMNYIDDTWFYKTKWEQFAKIKKILNPSKQKDTPFRDPQAPPDKKKKDSVFLPPAPPPSK